MCCGRILGLGICMGRFGNSRLAIGGLGRWIIRIRFADQTCLQHLSQAANNCTFMESALRNRLTFGTLMLGGLFLLLWLDDEAQRWTRHWMEQHFSVRGGIGGLG